MQRFFLKRKKKSNPVTRKNSNYKLVFKKKTTGEKKSMIKLNKKSILRKK